MYMNLCIKILLKLCFRCLADFIGIIYCFNNFRTNILYFKIICLYKFLQWASEVATC